MQGKQAEARRMVERDVENARERGAVLTAMEARVRLPLGLMLPRDAV